MGCYSLIYLGPSWAGFAPTGWNCWRRVGTLSKDQGSLFYSSGMWSPVQVGGGHWVRKWFLHAAGFWGYRQAFEEALLALVPALSGTQTLDWLRVNGLQTPPPGEFLSGIKGSPIRTSQKWRNTRKLKVSADPKTWPYQQLLNDRVLCLAWNSWVTSDMKNCLQKK